MRRAPQFTNSNLAAPPSDLIGPTVSISGVASFGTLSGSPTARVNQMYEGTDSISMQHGPNSFKAGVDLLYNNDTITFPGANRGSYSFSSLANFLSGTYNSSGYSQTFGVFQVHQTNPNVGFYAQDEYKASRNLTFNIGLRYDVELLKTIATQTQRFSARRVCLVAVRIAPHGGARRIRSVLRPHSAASAGQRPAFGGQHNKPERSGEGERQRLPRSDGRARISEYSRMPSRSRPGLFSAFPPWTRT